MSRLLIDNLPVQNISILNYSTYLNGYDLQLGVDAIQFQLSRHFKPIWFKNGNLTIYNARQNPPPNAWQIIIADNEEQLQKFGYRHLTRFLKPLARVLLEDEHKKGSPWTVETSRLAMTLLLDPELNHLVMEDYVVEKKDDGTLVTEKYGFTFDACSPCRGFRNSYRINNHFVSDFVTPNWFKSSSLLKGEDVPEGQQHMMFDYCNHIEESFGVLDEGFSQIYDFSQNKWTFLKGENTDDSLIKIKPFSLQELRVKDRQTFQKSKL